MLLGRPHFKYILRRKNAINAPIDTRKSFLRTCFANFYKQDLKEIRHLSQLTRFSPAKLSRQHGRRLLPPRVIASRNHAVDLVEILIRTPSFVY